MLLLKRDATMRTSLGLMEGDEWEKYCQKLLRMRYTDYQQVPARFGGDYGIEGFTYSGITFQCYCPDEDPSGIDLYNKQRDKITRDIKKLVKNAPAISSLGAGTIQEWHFLTPVFNHHQLLSHCRLKESEVRSKSLTTVHNEFKIYIKTEDDYIPERQVYIGTGGHRVQPAREEPTTSDLEKLLISDNQIVRNITMKLAKLKVIPEDLRANLTRQLVSGYIVGQGELETLNEKFPSTYQSVLQLKSSKESQLAIQALSTTDNHGTILHTILQEYEGKLSAEFSGSLSSALIARLSTGAISEWLGRCPLDFPEFGGQ
jgi:hypothetical protein